MCKIEKQYMYCEVVNKIGHVFFDRPPLNLFTWGVFIEFNELIDELHKLINQDEVRVIVLSSAVKKAFSAGDDIKDGPQTSDEAVRQNNIAREIMKKLSNVPVPVIGAINGYTMGGGAVLALTCDYLISAEDAKFSFSEIDFGMFPNWGTTMVLGRNFSLPIIKRLLFTGERFNPELAKELGIIQEIVSLEKLIPRAIELAKLITEKAPIGIRCLKTLLNSSANGISDEGHYHLETIYTRLTFDSEDTAEGVEAFTEKRKPEFRNR